MASLVDRKDSQFWWIKFIDPTTDKRVFESTHLRKKDSLETKKARALEASWTSKEKNTTAVVATSNHSWAEWVPSFLKRHCKGRTYERYVLAWNWIFSYLREIGVNRPSELTYKHCLAYLEWRTTKDTRLNSRRKKTKPISLNTALHEIKVLRLVMNQAIKQGLRPRLDVEHLLHARGELGIRLRRDHPVLDLAPGKLVFFSVWRTVS